MSDKVHDFFRRALDEAQTPIQTKIPDSDIAGPSTPMLKAVKAGPKTEDGAIFSSRVTELQDDGSLKQASPAFIQGFQDKMAEFNSAAPVTNPETVNIIGKSAAFVAGLKSVLNV